MTSSAEQHFSITDVPEFRRLLDANPQNQGIDAVQAIIMYGRAIHWAAIIDILWPDFGVRDYYGVEVAYIVANDPDNSSLPPTFFRYIAQVIAAAWQTQLTQKYPAGRWSVAILDDPEITVQAEIHSRG